jgi:large subunit ribosomal protein L3
MRTVVEFRDADLPGTEERKVGGDVTVADFEPGDSVKVSAVSIGKGFQGTIKRHNFSRGPVSHGSHNIRAPGSIGASADPARVFKGMRMPGRMGGGRVTQRGAEIVEVDPERNLLLIRGSVPGPRNATVEVRSNG